MGVSHLRQYPGMRPASLFRSLAPRSPALVLSAAALSCSTGYGGMYFAQWVHLRQGKAMSSKERRMADGRMGGGPTVRRWWLVLPHLPHSVAPVMRAVGCSRRWSVVAVTTMRWPLRRGATRRTVVNPGPSLSSLILGYQTGRAEV
ncbi:hypothetical protein HYQ46_008608 [Verticillium longisporum]|nr:hypothetical protein HYQ46_008608 [Verticillium longisporum]